MFVSTFPNKAGADGLPVAFREFQSPHSGAGEAAKDQPGNFSFRMWLAAFLLLGAVYASGMLFSQAVPGWLGDYPTRPVNGRLHFDRSSEILVEGLIDARLAGVPARHGGFMFRVPDDPRFFSADRLSDFRPDWIPARHDLVRSEAYRSQVGLQGRFYAAFAAALGLEREQALGVMRISSSAALAAMLATIIGFLHATWGRKPAIAALGFCTFSTGFNLFAPSLYWITFIHVAPMALVSVALVYCKSRWHWTFTFALLFLLFLAKLLSGYELLSVTVAATSVPLFLSYSAGWLRLGRVAGLAASFFFVGVLAFSASLGIYDHLYRIAFAGSGIDYILSRSSSFSTAAASGATDQLIRAGKVALVNFVDVYGFGIPNLVPLLAGMLFVARAGWALMRGRLIAERAKTELAVAAAFLASISWMVLQVEHVFQHSRYSTIILAFPFGIILVAGVVRLMELNRARLRIAEAGRGAA
jgi:hypothetical protein